jgi:3-oxoacyl-[acyl-carrier-protein] synthase-3
MNVFSFGITKAPQNVKQLFTHFNIQPETIDYFVFHQANIMMNEKIRKKLDLPPERVPYSLDEYGNTSCATIPLTMAVRLGDELTGKSSKLLMCGFGVGLSWGSLYVESQPLKVLDCIEV